MLRCVNVYLGNDYVSPVSSIFISTFEGGCNYFILTEYHSRYGDTYHTYLQKAFKTCDFWRKETIKDLHLIDGVLLAFPHGLPCNWDYIRDRFMIIMANYKVILETWHGGAEEHKNIWKKKTCWTENAPPSRWVWIKLK